MSLSLSFAFEIRSLKGRWEIDQDQDLSLTIELGSQQLQRVTNHPVHIIDEDGNLSPTTLIPFCAFSNNFSVMGIKIDQFSVPVCNSFRPKIIQDQLCYEVDPNEYKKLLNNDEIELGLTLYINYNEERDTSFQSQNSNDNHIILDTIGNFWL